MKLQLANRFSVVGNTAILYCPYKGSQASVLIDAADILDVIPFAKWRVASFRSRGTTKFYCCASVNRKTVYLHRFLMKPGPGLVVDHRNHRGTDNRRSNLRVCTESVNQLNRKVRFEHSKSGFRGAVWDTRCGKYIAKVNARSYGRFTDPAQASERVQEVLRQLGVIQ